MEKKNTMLLTVIAVATLLVAVVGATFAYFSLTVDTKGYTKTTAEVTSESVALITLTNTNKDLNVIEKDTDRDNFMDSKEALDYGIIDKIIENKKL